MKKLVYLFQFIFVLLGVLIGSTRNVYADTSAPEITIRPVMGFRTLSQAINTLYSVAMFGGALICFGYLVFGAFKYVTAGENASQVDAARKTMMNAVIGLVLLGLIVVIFQIVIRIVPGLDQWFKLAA